MKEVCDEGEEGGGGQEGGGQEGGQEGGGQEGGQEGGGQEGGQEGGGQEGGQEGGGQEGGQEGGGQEGGGQEGTEQPEVPEIHWNELTVLELLGRGTYGRVHKGKWRGELVAVKIIDTALEKRALSSEAKQLQRVKHENIVKLYGACYSYQQSNSVSRAIVGIVMEFMECGSLHDVLHGSPKLPYTNAHGISWMTQCSNAIAYLHNSRLVHRDLKPPNLLLADGWRLVKVCDFGTVASLKTTMTNNRGSAAWMAPEVFEGSKYGEKCDVFSFGVILWEVLVRRRPYEDLGGGHAYSILWQVHEGLRPHPVSGVPHVLKRLLNSCLEKVADMRPSMHQVFKIMQLLIKLFPGGDEPLKAVDVSAMETSDDIRTDTPTSDVGTLLAPGSGTPLPLRVSCFPSPPQVLESSLESLASGSGATGVPFRPGHHRRRGGSYETALLPRTNAQTSSQTPTAASSLRRSNSSVSGPRPQLPSRALPHAFSNHHATRSASHEQILSASNDNNVENSTALNADDCTKNPPFEFIEQNLLPRPPIENEESVRIYSEHTRIMEDYTRVLREKDEMLRRKNEMVASINRSLEFKDLQSQRRELESKKNELLCQLNARNGLDRR